MHELTNQINNLRKSNKNNWYFLNTTFKDNSVKIKGFSTWLEVFEVNGVDYSNCMNESVNHIDILN